MHWPQYPVLPGGSIALRPQMKPSTQYHGFHSKPLYRNVSIRSSVIILKHSLLVCDVCEHAQVHIDSVYTLAHRQGPMEDIRYSVLLLKGSGARLVASQF